MSLSWEFSYVTVTGVFTRQWPVVVVFNYPSKAAWRHFWLFLNDLYAVAPKNMPILVSSTEVVLHTRGRLKQAWCSKSRSQVHQDLLGL